MKSLIRTKSAATFDTNKHKINPVDGKHRAKFVDEKCRFTAHICPFAATCADIMLHASIYRTYLPIKRAYLPTDEQKNTIRKTQFDHDSSGAKKNFAG